MSGSLQVIKNDYFTYIQDGDSEITFRTKDQVWNTTYRSVAYTIHVSGPNAQPAFVGMYNAFAKKHLLTIKGGKQGGGQYPAALEAMTTGNARDVKKLQSVFDRAVTGKLSGIHGNRQHGDMYDYYGGRQDKSDQMDPSSASQYQVNTLGGKAQDTTVPLTMVLCDQLSFDELKEAFASAIAKRGPLAVGVLHGVVVSFDTNCVYQHNDITNTFGKGDRIRVSVYIQAANATDVTAHVVHCEGT